ncbi:MAG: tubulin--tyrosine ligase family protein [Marinobacterium sp.]|nr:tubulin--tyrosine ligase family protein [Marinobacterium sp.]
MTESIDANTPVADIAETVTQNEKPEPALAIFTNRASPLFARAAAQVEAQLPATARHRFSYWATFYGENPDAQADDIQLIDRSVTNLAESKSWIARQVIARGLEALFPRSCFSVNDALAYQYQCPLWFSKPVHLSGGRGIECVASGDLADYSLPQHHILQQGIQNLALLDGRKFTGRIYILVWNQQLWLFDDGFILLHGVPFDPASTGYDVHVDHRGYEKDDSPVEMRLLSSLADFDQRWPVLQAAAAQLRPLFSELLDASASNRYVMLGIDFLLQENNELQFIEVNAIPNFIHSSHINSQLNVPFFTQSLQLMLGLEAPRLFTLD